MKIILSRKGFDSSFGGVASPVFIDDNTFLSFPIPSSNSEEVRGCGYTISYNDLNSHGHNYGKLVQDLTSNKIKNKLTGDMLVHLDPDISENVYDRGNNEWGPMFGQDGSAQGHLRKQNIGKGDIFLFFGLYGWVSKNEGKYRYVRGEKKFHMLWGLMQIEDVIHFDNPDEINRVKEWMKSHPHFYLQGAKQNTLYIGRKDLIVDGKLIAQNCGTGTFEKYRDELQLTRKGSHKLTDWLVPSFLFNSDKKKLPTYHQNHNLWNQEEDKYNLKAASIGQEFVFDCAEHPGAIDWLKKLIKGEEQ